MQPITNVVKLNNNPQYNHNNHDKNNQTEHNNFAHYFNIEVERINNG